MKALVAALGAAALLGGAAHASSGSVIVFAADRMPSVSGDVYRVDANGHVANLTHSPWQETQPLVSPDGKRVAFVSDRGGGGLWVVGVGGSDLRRLAAAGMPSQYDVQMAWSPGSRELAYTTGGSAHGQKLWLVSLGSTPRKIASSNELGWPSWSPDGRLLTVFDGGALDAFTATGRRAWSVTSGRGPIGWSARGFLATGIYDGATHVVDERGKQRFVAPADRVAWSANGGMLATVKGRRLEVHATGGAIVLRTTLPQGSFGMEWVASNAVAYEDATGAGHRVAIPSGVTTTVDLSAFGLNTLRTGSTFAVRDGTHVYTDVPGCFDDGGPNAGITSLQRVPHSSSVVYESYCPEAFANLYAVRSDGTGLHRITNVQENQLDPAISPDGTRVAYAQSDAVGMSCKGCPQSLHVMNVDGSGDETLTSPPDCTFDDSPSWSPDAKTIMFVHSACDIAPHALTVAGGGGPTTDVHIPAWTLAWGPERVAYANGNTVPSSMWTSLADGTDRQRVAGIGAGLTSPAWSADGRLAYLEGTTVVVQGKRVPLPFVQVRTLAWSPDGTHFVVAAKQLGTASFDVYTVRTDGTGLRRITRNVDASSADWR